jgi:DNA-binding winged helix-turn-helix (wHTH) protein
LTDIFLIGFGHPDSIRLVEEMKGIAPQHTFADFPDSREETPYSSDEGSAVTLVWCSRSQDEVSSAVAQSVSSGLPVLALLQNLEAPDIDFSGGHIELAFAPVDATEILVRIDLVLARAHGPKDRNLISHGDLVIDQDRYEVRLGGNAVDLTYKEYELLKYIAARPGRVFSREALLRAVWDYDYFGGTRTVDVHVRRLRSKINDVRYQFIETVWNVGYRFRSGGNPDDSRPE